MIKLGMKMSTSGLKIKFKKKQRYIILFEYDRVSFLNKLSNELYFVSIC
jgi:hypothetical protein